MILNVSRDIINGKRFLFVFFSPMSPDFCIVHRMRKQTGHEDIKLGLQHFLQPIVQVVCLKSFD